MGGSPGQRVVMNRVLLWGRPGRWVSLQRTGFSRGTSTVPGPFHEESDRTGGGST